VTLDDLRPGWRSDFILHRHGAQVLERADCLVVRTPANPHFYWGNFLLLPQAPRDHELAHWMDRFDEEITRLQPASQHVALGVNAPPAGEALPTWLGAGFERIQSAVLELRPGQLRAPARAARGAVQVRPLDLAHELEAVVALQAADPHGFDLAHYTQHRRAQMQRYARMAEAGEALWFGVWCDGVLAADCGLMRTRTEPGALGRFQHVSTHPLWRRRGLCSALVQAVCRHGFEAWGVARLLMCADPDDVAIGIYESLGFARIDAEWGLQLRAPHDRADAADAADEATPA
jgi:ribosomal protein S18 acetylase RimI-like enzyme